MLLIETFFTAAAWFQPPGSIEGVIMADQFLGEIRYVGFNFAPQGWALCNGQILSISEYDALFALIGTTYGGDGQTTFALPSLESRVALHQGGEYVIGATGGTENVTLLSSEIPAHQHAVQVFAGAGNSPSPSGSVFAAESSGHYVAAASATGAMDASMVSLTGQSQPHSNIQPYLAITCIIALDGIFPSRN
jgi:microcystin-dependent protein